MSLTKTVGLFAGTTLAFGGVAFGADQNNYAAEIADLKAQIAEMKSASGDSWLTERAGAPGHALGRRDTWKLLEVHRGRARLSFSGVLGSAPSPAREGLSGTEEGTVEAELASGALIFSSSRQQLHGTIVVQGLPVPMEISGTSTIRQMAQSAR